MVRLKAPLREMICLRRRYFNSNMVRLKVLKSKNYRVEERISIPIWYD